jgi:hypothetical protein
MGYLFEPAFDALSAERPTAGRTGKPRGAAAMIDSRKDAPYPDLRVHCERFNVSLLEKKS